MRTRTSSLTGGSALAHNFDVRQKGVKLAYLHGPGKLAVQVSNGLNQTRSGSANIGDIDPQKDIMTDKLILIIEDNEKNLKVVRDVLQFKGYRTVEAMTAEKGLEMARSQQPALILMDIQLPGMDGVTALGHLRADPLT